MRHLTKNQLSFIRPHLQQHTSTGKGYCRHSAVRPRLGKLWENRFLIHLNHSMSMIRPVLAWGWPTNGIPSLAYKWHMVQLTLAPLKSIVKVGQLGPAKQYNEGPIFLHLGHHNTASGPMVSQWLRAIWDIRPKFCEDKPNNLCFSLLIYLFFTLLGNVRWQW